MAIPVKNKVYLSTGKIRVVGPINLSAAWGPQALVIEVLGEDAMGEPRWTQDASVEVDVRSNLGKLLTEGQP